MFSFHKPKIFRSVHGCCICKAKSSSSRFTDSKRYEPLFEKCFGLVEERSGEICNACVLLVKRYMKLPAGSSRHWNHVVDARSGPGIKSLVRAKKQQSKTTKTGENLDENMCETPEKIKRKHVYQRKNRRTPLADKIIRNRHPSIDISPFLDMTVWKREKICCGIVFRSPHGEFAVDSRYYRPCAGCRLLKEPILSSFSASGATVSTPPLTSNEDEDDEMEEDVAARLIITDEDEDETDSVEETEAEAATKFSEEDSNLYGDDEGFFDRPAVSPESGTSTPPPATAATHTPVATFLTAV